MARLNKKGLDYFSHDIDLSNDDKIQVLEAEHDLIGYAIYIKFLEKIYRNSYFMDFDDRKFKIFAMNNRIKIEKLFEILETLFNENLLDKEKYDKYKILTSYGIQDRYVDFVVKSKRKGVIMNAFFLTEKINSRINSINSRINLIDYRIILINSGIKKQSKVKESKVKESKVNKEKNKIGIFKDNLFEILKIKTKQENDIIDLLKTFDIEILIEAMKNFRNYQKGASKRQYAYGKNWTKFYEFIGLWTNQDEINFLIEKESGQVKQAPGTVEHRLPTQQEYIDLEEVKAEARRKGKIRIAKEEAERRLREEQKNQEVGYDM